MRERILCLAERLGLPAEARRCPAGRLQASVVLVSDHRIAELNRRYLGRNRTTDVLAFPLGTTDPETGRWMLGEVYVSRDRARVQGREYGTGYVGETERLALHGLLHLFGVKHREMEPLYERYLGRGAEA